MLMLQVNKTDKNMFDIIDKRSTVWGQIHIDAILEIAGIDNAVEVTAAIQAGENYEIKLEQV
jgi:hypothetical protein